jgi:hypothetical protein
MAFGTLVQLTSDGTWSDLNPVIQPGLMMQSWQRLAP